MSYEKLSTLLEQRRRHGQMSLPNVIGVGAARSGTSSLTRALNAHPDVWVSPQKEMNFFGIHGALQRATRPTLSEYGLFFEEGRTRRVRAELTPVYLAHGPSLPHLVETIPDVKAIVQLRDPLDRFWSQFKYHAEAHGIARFSEYVDRAVDEYNEHTWYTSTWFSPPKVLTQSLYTRGINFLLAHLGTDRVLVLDYRELVSAPAAYLRRVFDFLGLAEQENAVDHANAGPAGDLPRLDTPGMQRLKRIFAADQARLQRLIGWSYDEDA